MTTTQFEKFGQKIKCLVKDHSTNISEQFLSKYPQWDSKKVSPFHFSNYKSMETFSCYSNKSTLAISIKNNMSQLMTKPTKWPCPQRRLRSAWASVQSDQSLRCALNGKLRTQSVFMRTAKTLIRLGWCPGWPESLLGAHSHYRFCHVAAHILSVEANALNNSAKSRLYPHYGVWGVDF